LKWLLNVDDARGELLCYHERLAERYMNISELCLIEEGPNGEVPDPQFFIDLGVKSQDHQEAFRKWFHSQAP